jgi:hypothetical protein
MLLYCRYLSIKAALLEPSTLEHQTALVECCCIADICR